jgi:hypothetical protein
MVGANLGSRSQVAQRPLYSSQLDTPFFDKAASRIYHPAVFARINC